MPSRVDVLEQLLTERYSCRAFLPQQVPSASAAPDPPTTKAPRHGSVVATEAPEMPFDAPEDPEAYYITKVEPKTAKNGKSTYWTLTFNRAITDDGWKLANVAPQLPDVAALAVDAAKHHWPVIADVVKDGKYTNVIALEVVRE